MPSEGYPHKRWVAPREAVAGRRACAWGMGCMARVLAEVQPTDGAPMARQGRGKAGAIPFRNSPGMMR